MISVEDGKNTRILDFKGKTDGLEHKTTIRGFPAVLISYWQGNDLVIQTIRDETTIYNQGKINVKRVLTMSADKKMITECRIGTATDGSQSSSAAIWDRQ